MTIAKHDQYVFEDYLLNHPKISRDQAEFEWHREKQVPSNHTYSPDESKIDFFGPTWDEFHDNRK